MFSPLTKLSSTLDIHERSGISVNEQCERDSEHSSVNPSLCWDDESLLSSDIDDIIVRNESTEWNSG